jgi:hypothetical protein
VAVEEWPGAIGSPCHFADEGDVIQASESREIGFATRELLLTRVKHLSAALDQLNEGKYGGECGEPIAPALTAWHARGAALRPVPGLVRGSRPLSVVKELAEVSRRVLGIPQARRRADIETSIGRH